MNRAIRAAIVIGLYLGGVGSALATVPSNSATIQDRIVPKDGNGSLFPTIRELGYKVFVSTASGPVQLVDEAGNTPTSGLISQICLSSGTAATEWAVVYDSAPVFINGLSTTNQGTNLGLEVTPVVNRVTSGEHCSPVIDGQFNYGAVILQSTTNGSTHVYWRPSRGGRN